MWRPGGRKTFSIKNVKSGVALGDMHFWHRVSSDVPGQPRGVVQTFVLHRKKEGGKRVHFNFGTFEAGAHTLEKGKNRKCSPNLQTGQLVGSQVVGLHLSLRCGLRLDSPHETGSSRVKKGRTADKVAVKPQKNGLSSFLWARGGTTDLLVLEMVSAWPGDVWPCKTAASASLVQEDDRCKVGSNFDREKSWQRNLNWSWRTYEQLCWRPQIDMT